MCGHSLAGVRSITEIARPFAVRIALIYKVQTDRELDMEIRGTLTALQHHFELLKRTGSSNSQLHFEDSDICFRSPFYSCSSSRCALMHFVPKEFRSETAPCRHIPLNAKGESLEMLYGIRTTHEIDSAVRAWLSSVIETLESIAETEGTGRTGRAT